MTRHSQRCKHSSTGILSSHLGARASRRSFNVPGSMRHYAPDLPVRLEHVRLDVTVDPIGKKLSGTATQTIKVIAPAQKRIRMDQVALQISEARVDGKKAPHSIDGHALWIDLPKAFNSGDVFEVAVDYQVVDPPRGLYFTGPDEFYPAKRHQVWAQGQDEDNRHWFPSFDYPNQKATSEIVARVPKGYTAVSNGALLSKKDVAAGHEFHYKLGTPHVVYLITLAVGEFEAWEDQGPRGLPVQYFVEPGRKADGVRAFSHTPQMIEAYEKRTGVAYPYEKYSQVAVQDFIFGGMENTSATTQTDLTLHDERAHLDFSSDPLVSHELAHQWFGDLLTCRDWSHGWLNEGFATFMERVWIEEDQGPDGGRDEARYYGYLDLKEYLGDDGARYRRPIVSNQYIEPIDLFDSHLYQKGGLVLNLVRHVLGEEPFWKAVNLYVTRHRGGSVETVDLIRAIEDATGRNLRRLFDEWVFGGGHPELELTYAWHDDAATGNKTAEVTIEQKQTGGKPSVTEDGVTTHLFHVSAAIEFTLAKEGGGSEVVSHVIQLGDSARDRVFVTLPSKPVMVRFDRGNHIPKTLRFERPKELLTHQLAHDDDCMGRIEAARHLIKIADREVVAALAQAGMSDRFWGVQAAVAEALGEIRTDAARDALIGMLSINHPKARRAVVAALGDFRDAVSAAALKKLADKDPSYFVEADALFAWSRAQLGPVPAPKAAEVEHAEATLLRALDRDSYRDVIRASALRALSKLPGVGRGERPRAVQALIDWSRRGQPADARLAAVVGLVRVLGSAVPSEKSRLLDALAQLAEEHNFRVRMALVTTLGASDAPEAIAILGRIQATDSDGRVKREAAGAIAALEAAGTTPEAVTRMREAHDKLEEDYRKLKSLVEEIKGGVAGGPAKP